MRVGKRFEFGWGIRYLLGTLKSHIGLSQLPSPFVLVCGAPERAQRIANRLHDAKTLAQNREYHSYGGFYRGKPVTVVSHGVGAAGAAICFHELIEAGAKVIIRLGTAGGLHESTQIGDVIVATGAIRNDGVSAAMVPLEFPAVPDIELTLALIHGMQSQQLRGRSGVILTSDLFYPGLLDDRLAFYQKAGAVGVEMECSALFVIAQLKKVRTASMLVLDGNPLKWDEGIYDPQSPKLVASMDQAIDICLTVLTTH